MTSSITWWVQFCDPNTNVHDWGAFSKGKWKGQAKWVQKTKIKHSAGLFNTLSKSSFHAKSLPWKLLDVLTAIWSVSTEGHVTTMRHLFVPCPVLWHLTKEKHIVMIHRVWLHLSFPHSAHVWWEMQLKQFQPFDDSINILILNISALKPSYNQWFYLHFLTYLILSLSICNMFNVITWFDSYGFLLYAPI